MFVFVLKWLYFRYFFFYKFYVAAAADVKKINLLMDISEVLAIYYTYSSISYFLFDAFWWKFSHFLHCYI